MAASQRKKRINVAKKAAKAKKAAWRHESSMAKTWRRHHGES
jgi:hypothetical protein